MDAINTLRIVLVGGAAVAAAVAAVGGHWATVGILLVGLAGHAWLWVERARGRTTAPPAVRAPEGG